MLLSRANEETVLYGPPEKELEGWCGEASLTCCAAKFGVRMAGTPLAALVAAHLTAIVAVQLRAQRAASSWFKWP